MTACENLADRPSISVWLLLVAATYATVGCLVPGSSVLAQGTQQLTIYESNHPSALDPYTGTEAISRRFVSLYCRPLFQYEYISELGRDKYKPLIACPEITLIDGGNKVKVAIRKDAYFYRFKEVKRSEYQKDSIKVTAQDVVVTYENLVDRQSRLGSSRHADRLRKVVDNMRAISDDTVLVEFKPGKKPDQPEKYLDFPVVPASAVPRGPIEMNPSKGSKQAEFMEKPYGHGPFAIRSINDRGGELYYVFSRVAPRAVGKFQEITIRVKDWLHIKGLLNRGFPGMMCMPSAPIGLMHVVDSDKFKVTTLYYPKVEQILFNHRREYLNELRVRTALSVYIDRETLQYEYAGEADIVNGPIPFGYPYYCYDCDIPYYEHNRELADSLLKAAGWKKNSSQKWERNGKTLKIEVIAPAGVGGSSVAQRIVHSIVEGWKSYGIDATDSFVPLGPYWKRLKDHDFDAAFHVLEYGFHPELNRHFVTNGAENYSDFSDAVVDSLWRSFKTVADAELIPLWRKLHERIGLQVPCAFLWTPQNYAVYTSYIDIRQDFYPHNFIGLVEEWRSTE